jgi:hypothetical protein
MFVHTVYFYLKPNTPPAAVAQLVADCHGYLGKIPGVQHLWAGVPAATSRPVIDKTYGVGLTVILNDLATHDLYQDHPLHLEFIARNKEHWQRVQVYDYQ